MNKERLGNFIGGERRSLGLTQKDLAARLHVTDKAVSKWERGMSYPDVTLLEPLAAALDLTVEELMACRRQAVKGEEETMQNLLDISRDSVRKERRRSWKRLAAVLVLLAITAAVVAWTQIMVTEDVRDTLVLTETVDGVDYVYIEGEEGHLIKLKCGSGVDIDGIQLTDQAGWEQVFQISCRYNRLTHEGTVTALEATGNYSLGGIMDAQRCTARAKTTTPIHTGRVTCATISAGSIPIWDLLIPGTSCGWRTASPPRPGTPTATASTSWWSAPAGRRNPIPSTIWWTGKCRRSPGRTRCRRRFGKI